MLLLAGIAGALVWRIAWRLTTDTTAAWFTWAAIVGRRHFSSRA